MSLERLVVVGGVAAGLSAASRARRVNPHLEIWVYEKGPDISYSACGFPHLISGQIKEADALRVYSPEFFRTERNIQVFTQHEVTEVLVSRRRINVVKVRGGAPQEVHFDRLILATGGEPDVPSLTGLDLRGVFSVNDFQSTLALKHYLESERPSRATVIGGGYVGLEMADALAARGLQVTVLERTTALCETTEAEIVGLIELELAEHGVHLVKNATVAGLSGDKQGRIQSVCSDQGETETDCVILATGVRPRVKLAIDAGLRIGPSGAIAVNEFMETSEASVFAAGDCAETVHLVSGRPAYLPRGTTANKQGRVAGENAAGRRARFPGAVGTAACKVFSLEVARTGLSSQQAQEVGFQACAATIKAPSHARYLGGKDVLVKLIADRVSGRLLGAQMAGTEGVAKRIDVLATVLMARMTIEQLAQLDLSYSPPFSTAWDPILIAAQEMLRELRR